MSSPMQGARLTLSRLVNLASAGRLKLGWWSAPYRSTARPVIIGGSPRSGSTLLRVMLDSHPDFWIGPENGVFQEAGFNFPGMEACLGLPEKALRAIRRGSSNLGEFVERTMDLAPDRNGKPVWGIKSPAVVHSLATVFHFFPGARFIHTVRDGRDVACSLRTHPKYRVVDGRRVPTGVVNPWPDCVARWNESTTAGLKWCGSPQYYEVRYEELVAEPERVARGLLAWLDAPFHEAVLHYHARPVSEGIDSPHPGISQPIYTSAVSRWKTDLPREALLAFTADARSLLVNLGYAHHPDDWSIELARVESEPPRRVG